MSNRLTKRSQVSYTAAVPAVPGRPGYCTTVAGTQIQYLDFTTFKSSGLATVFGVPPIIKSHTDALGNTIIDEYLVPVAVLGSTSVCYPAVAGTPGKEAQQVTDNQQGWNAGARSATDEAGDFEARFKFPQHPSGASLCGFADPATSIGYFAGIEHALYTGVVSVEVYEKGVKVAILDANVSDSPQLSIRRVGGKVTYTAGSSSYTSPSRSSGSKALTAALYTAGDYVDSPALLPVFTFSAHDPMSLGGGFDTFSSHGTALLSGSAFAAGGEVGAPTTVETAGGEMVFSMSMAGIDAQRFYDAAYPDVSVYARGAEVFDTSGYLTLGGPNAFGSVTTNAPAARFGENVALTDRIGPSLSVFAVFGSNLGVTDSMELLVFYHAAMGDHLVTFDNWTLAGTLAALMGSTLTVTDSQGTLIQDLLQYVTNVATGGVTRYSNYGFTDFTQVGLKTFAVKPDGLYELAGDTDDGTLISAAVDFITEDFGTAMKKRVDNIYIGLATDGQVFVKLEDDFGGAITYRAAQYQNTQKVKTAKGVSSRLWKMRLEIVDATYGDIDNVEWYVGATGRRLGR